LPNGEGIVTSAPIERTVPFVVVPILSTLRLPALSTTNGPVVQLVNVRALVGPLTVVPVNVLVLPMTADSLHVLKKPPLVVCSIREFRPRGSL
jgi:hypothetical protein